jgi:multiple sugar transport system substrate-binding protein
MESIVETVSTAYPLTGDSGTKWPIVNEAISVAIQAVITGQADPQTAMETAQAAVSK